MSSEKRPDGHSNFEYKSNISNERNTSFNPKGQNYFETFGNNNNNTGGTLGGPEHYAHFGGHGSSSVPLEDEKPFYQKPFQNFDMV